MTISVICAFIGFVTFLICESVAGEDAKLIALVIFIISAIASFNYSIKSNNSLPRAFLSFVLKVLLSFLLVVKLLELIGNKNDESNEISQRTKKWQLFTTGVFSFLIFKRIKEHSWKGNLNSH